MNCSFSISENIHKMNWSITGPKQEPNDPVSYTHLDVYKRQVIVCHRKKITLDKKTVAGKLPLSLNRSSPKQ